MFENTWTSQIKEDKAGEAWERLHLIAVNVRIVLASWENEHDDSGGDERKEGNGSDEQRKDDVELAEPEYLEQSQTENDMFDRHWDIIGDEISNLG